MVGAYIVLYQAAPPAAPKLTKSQIVLGFYTAILLVYGAEWVGPFCTAPPTVIEVG